MNDALKNVDSIEIWAQDDNTYRYLEVEASRVLAQDGSMGRITVRHQDPSVCTEEYQLVFAIDAKGNLSLKGEFFDDPGAYKECHAIDRGPDYATYEVYEENDTVPWVVKIDYAVIDPNLTPSPVSTRESPMIAKAFKDSFNDLTRALASRDSRFRDTDGIPRVYVKFLNGRTVQVQHLDDATDEDKEEIFYIHDTDYVSIKKYWTSVSSAIIFSVGFRFSYADNQGNEVVLLICRCPDDKHPADNFCADILTGMQTELEEVLNDDLKSTIEDGFKRIEKLIVSNKTATIRANK